METEIQDKPSLVFNWGVALNVLGAMLSAGLVALPAVQSTMTPNLYAIVFLLFAVLNGGYIVFSRYQVQSLTNEVAVMTSQRTTLESRLRAAETRP